MGSRCVWRHHAAMNPKLDPPEVLRSLGQRVIEPQWSANATLLLGRLGAARCRARVFPHGLTVALQLARPLHKAPEACLLLAATPAACDDAVYVAEGGLWLLRRYLPRLTEVEFDLLLKQQQALSSLLAWQPDANGGGTLPAGRYA